MCEEGEEEIGGNVLRQILHALEIRHATTPLLARERLVQFMLQLRQHAGRAQHPVQQRAAGVARRVAAGDQLRERFGREFVSPQFLAVFVLAFHQPGEEIDPLRRPLFLPVFLPLFCRGEPFVDPRDGDPCEVFDGLESVAEEAVGEVFGEGF